MDADADADAVLASLADEPTHFPDCCCAISLRLVETLLERLPRASSPLVLSIGAGSGLLEELLRRKSDHRLNLFGVEVPTCQNRYLPEERMLRVPSSTELHRDALLAEAFLFVYPRKSSLLQAYIAARGAMHMLLLILNRSDWDDFGPILESAFSNVEIIHNSTSGLPAYELLAMASQPKVAPSNPAAG